jgi:small conductance mechanosensitive channel
LVPGHGREAVQALLDEEVTTPTRAEPHIDLEEVDCERVVVRIAATPRSDDDGPRLADEVLAAVGQVTHAEEPVER